MFLTIGATLVGAPTASACGIKSFAQIGDCVDRIVAPIGEVTGCVINPNNPGC
jgi:hypothetical protein